MARRRNLRRQSACVGALVLTVAAAVALACLAWRDGPTSPDAGSAVNGARVGGEAVGGSAADESDQASRGVRDDGSDPEGDAGSQGVSSELPQGGGAARTLVEGDVVQVATDLLVSYRAQGSCVLAHAGYLDLLGNVWGCVVRGDQWVDVCIVRRRDGACQVDVTRLDAEGVARELKVDDNGERR